MKNKKILMILAMTAVLSLGMSACGFGGDNEDDAAITEVTPTPVPTQTPAPSPTIAPDVQDTSYTSSDNSLSIELPDATWANKTDEDKMVSFESPEQGRILILYGSGEEDMAAAIIPSSQDTAVALQQAEDMTEGTDFEIQDYTANDVNGVGVYSYVVKMLNTEKSGGYSYVINKVFANDNEFYNISASVIGDSEDTLNKMKQSVESFTILGDSTLKSAAPGTSSTGDATGTDGQATGDTTQSTDGTDESQGSTDSGSSNSSGVSDEALSDTNQTRTIYRNSDGHPLVIYNDGNGNWSDADGNMYDFANEQDVYDQNDVDYYYHGEAADVYYMPLPDSTEESYE